jgi:hypothetical protein
VLSTITATPLTAVFITGVKAHGVCPFMGGLAIKRVFQVYRKVGMYSPPALSAIVGERVAYHTLSIDREQQTSRTVFGSPGLRNSDAFEPAFTNPCPHDLSATRLSMSIDTIRLLLFYPAVYGQCLIPLQARKRLF